MNYFKVTFLLVFNASKIIYLYINDVEFNAAFYDSSFAKFEQFKTNSLRFKISQPFAG